VPAALPSTVWLAHNDSGAAKCGVLVLHHERGSQGIDLSARCRGGYMPED